MGDYFDFVVSGPPVSDVWKIVDYSRPGLYTVLV